MNITDLHITGLCCFPWLALAGLIEKTGAPIMADLTLHDGSGTHQDVEIMEVNMKAATIVVVFGGRNPQPTTATLKQADISAITIS